MQAAVLDIDNAYYPVPCCPSPYHGFPATLGLELELGDDEAALKAIAEKLAEHDAVDRFSTWPTPVAMSIIEIGVEYGKGWALGEITDRNNADILMELSTRAFPARRSRTTPTPRAPRWTTTTPFCCLRLTSTIICNRSYKSP